MKQYIKLLGLSVAFSIVSCQGEPQIEKARLEKAAEVGISPENSEEANYKIEGMTCAMGCAKMIENKLESAEGVDSAKVDFKTKLAYVSFDKTRQSKVGLKKTIEALLDGTTYKASEIVTRTRP